MGKRKNSTKDERAALLKKLGYTEADMQGFWDECKEVNHKIKLLSNAGLNWTDLTVHQIEQLPTLKETTLKQLKEKEEREKAEAQAKMSAAEAEEYYWNHFEEIMLAKIDKGEALTEDELRELVFEYEHKDISDASEDSVLRWTRIKKTIIKLDNRYFRIIWQKALTEMQENVFDHQPVEVEEYEKVIVVKEWREVE